MATGNVSNSKFQQMQRNKLNSNNNSNLQKFIIQPKPIAVGSTCQVFLAINPQTRQSCAIKKLSEKYNFKPTHDQKEIQQFPEEFIEQIKILKNINHPNIIHLKDFLVKEQLQGQKSFHMVFDYLPFDLRKLLKSKVHLSEVEIKKILFQILCALKYMSEKGIMHRDIKPENILISQDLETVKVCDFGLAYQSQKKQKSDSDSNKAKQPSLSHHVVTRYYRPPEVILLAKNYDSKVDVWSVGCIFGELLQMLQQNSPNFKRVPLFAGKGCFPISPPKNKQNSDYKLKNGFAHSENDQLSKILDVVGSPKDLSFLSPETDSKSIKYFNSFDQYQKVPFSNLYEKISRQAQDLLQNLLKFNPNERLSAEQAMNHPYFGKVRKLYSKNYEKRYEQIEEFKNIINRPIGKLQTK